MLGKQAKVLLDDHLDDLLVFAWNSREAIRNEVLVLLSVKAGLRASEIAGLEWDMVLTASGEIGDTLEVRDSIAKNKSGRRIPLHPDLRMALLRWYSKHATPGPIIASSRGVRMHSVSIVNWFAKAYRAIGLAGCSSHSGRRTFITRAARMCTRPVARCATCSCWPVIDPFKPRNDTSTVTAMRSGGWSG